MPSKRLDVGGYIWKMLLIILTIMLLVTPVESACPPGWDNISGNAAKCFYVGTGLDGEGNFAHARYRCQAIHRYADTISIYANDVTEIVGNADYDDSHTYFVGLTDAEFAGSYKWVIDGATFDNTTQPFLVTDCPAAQDCRCAAFDSTTLNMKNCISDKDRFICGLALPNDPDCPSGWIGIKDRCYRYVIGDTSSTTFAQASAKCGSLGADLARANFYDPNYARILAERPMTNIAYLIGLRSEGTQYLWRDGTEPTLFNWVPGQPVSLCTTLGDNTVEGKLQSVPCTTSDEANNYICERVFFATTAMMGTTGMMGTTDMNETTAFDVTTKDTITVPDVTTAEVIDIVNATTMMDPGVDVTTRDRDITTEMPGEVTTDRGDPCLGVICDGSGAAIGCVAGNCQCVDNGYELVSTDGPCININECLNTSACTANYICFDTPGSFTCNCSAGFEPATAPATGCIQKVVCNPNPCIQGTTGNIICDPLTTTCSCPSGFELQSGSPIGPCIDINECTTNTAGCDVATTTCINTPGNFICQCISGFSQLSTTSCRDINECALDTDDCDTISTTCSNTPLGSFTCNCKSGFQSLDATSCTDINECFVNSINNCDLNSTTCVNIPLGGGFSCRCLSGYLVVSATSCQTPCDAGQHNCDLKSTVCIFLSGRFQCICREGYVATTISTICTRVAQCCPSLTPTSTATTAYYEFQGVGKCLYFLSSNLGSYDEVASLCTISTASDNFQGGRLLEIAGGTLNQSLLTFVSGSTFPSSVYIGFRRLSSSSAFIWNDSASTVLDNSNVNWLDSFPSTTADTNCGGIGKSSRLGYINIDCNTESYGLCEVSTLPCATDSRSVNVRMVVVVAMVNNEPAVHTLALEDPTSDKFKQIGGLMCEGVNKAVSDVDTCVLKGLKFGSIITYLEVNFTRSHTIAEIKNMMVHSGDVDDDGLHILTSKNGDTISFYPDRLEIDDMKNHVCSRDRCKNGGTCTQNDKYIEWKCSCTTGFQGTRCEAVLIDDTNIGMVITITVVAIIVFIVFVTCCCCLFIVMRGKSHSKEKMMYKYQPPVIIPQQFVMQDLSSKLYVNQRIVRNVAAKFDEDNEISAVKLPIIRNRGVDRDFARNNFDDEYEEIDEDTIIDEKKLSHFQRVFYAASELNSHMSSRGDAASVGSDSASSINSIIKPPFSETGLETIDENQEFNTPYTADGTANT